MRHILSLPIGSSRISSTEIIQFDGNEIRLTTLGVDYDTGLFETLLKDYDGNCDAICIKDLPPPCFVNKTSIRHDLYDKVVELVKETPVFYGHNLSPIMLTWSTRRSMQLDELRLDSANLVYLAGLEMHDLAKTLDASALSSIYLDAWTALRIPKSFKNLAAVEKYAAMASKQLVKRKLRAPSANGLADKTFGKWVRAQIRDADVIVTPSHYLAHYDLKVFKEKTLILDSLDFRLEDDLRKAGVQNVYYCNPTVVGISRGLDFSIMEALIAFKQGLDYALTPEDIIDYYNSSSFEAKLEQLDSTSAELPRKYAFVIHPLARRDLFRHPLLRPMMSLPNPILKSFEHNIAKIPGAVYGKVTGVRSEDSGVYAEGLIYTLFATPREMLQAKPEDIYQKLLAIGEHASARGAKIMGLGAFTKIVGDAGVTVAARSKIPVTTGNSLSAAATLWAAKEACKKMGFLKPIPDSTIRVEGTVMVIGATGSIGKACTSVLGASFSEIIIAAINVPRLITYKAELQAMYPEVKIHVTTQPERFADKCDLIVVSTSATEGGAFSLDRVKPGCVICDVSRPLTFSAEEAAKRPDVLVIESGEIELPGPDVKVSCDMGLEKDVVYACLAETALLALEGRYESFTLSRNVNYKKVKEIYKLARKHGARLAQIRSPNGIITDYEVELCRQHALKALNGDK